MCVCLQICESIDIYKNVVSCVEQVLEAAPHNIAAVRPSRKLSKLDELDMRETAGDVRSNL